MASLRKSLAKYIGLNVIGMMGVSFYILGDTFFVAQALGTVGLAALNFSISIYSVMQGVGLMLGIGGATYFALHRRHQAAKGDAAFTQSTWAALILAVVFMVIGLFFTEPLAQRLGADAEALPMTRTYLRTILIFSPFFLFNNILLAFVRNDNAPRLAMTAMLVSTFSNIVLDYIFMFPLEMGMFGAAFATGLAPIISLGILSTHILTKQNTFRLMRNPLRLPMIRDMSSYGFSSFIVEMASAVTLITFNQVIFRLEGNVGVAAYGIVANMALIATALFVGIGQGLQPLASTRFGRKDLKAVRLIRRDTLGVALVFSILIYATVFVGAEPIVAAFNSEQDPYLGQLATHGFQVFFLGYFFAGINIVAAAFLSAIAHTRQATAVSLLRSLIVLVPLVFILSAFFAMEGVWWSFVITEAVVCVIALVFLRRMSFRDELVTPLHE